MKSKMGVKEVKVYLRIKWVLEKEGVLKSKMGDGVAREGRMCRERNGEGEE